MWTDGFQNPLLQPFRFFDLLGVVFFVVLVNRLIHLEGVKSICCQIRSGDWWVSLMIGLTRFVVAGYRFRTTPDCNG
jgi:hypothetical protein